MKFHGSVCALLCLTIVACGERNTSVTRDVVSPVTNPARSWVANLSIGPDLRKLLMNFGYIEGSNCFQVIENQWRDGRTLQTVELFSGPCRPFVSQSIPVASFHLRRDVSYGESGFVWLVAGNNVIVGRASVFPNSNTLWNLCDMHFSAKCDLALSPDGQISSFQLK